LKFSLSLRVKASARFCCSERFRTAWVSRRRRCGSTALPMFGREELPVSPKIRPPVPASRRRGDYLWPATIQWAEISTGNGCRSRGLPPGCAAPPRPIRQFPAKTAHFRGFLREWAGKVR